MGIDFYRAGESANDLSLFMENERKIKVYCPEHQATCEVAAKPHIVCTIEEHSLSNNFPQAEFWEFCADCQTFLPTKLAVGVRAVSACPNCSREPARRFLCENCHIETFESDEPARGKIYRLSGANGVEPNCPGCQIPATNGAAKAHYCSQIEAEILTSRSICPFCLEQVVRTNELSTAAVSGNDAAEETGKCSQCGAMNPPTAVFCGKCRNQLRKDVVSTNFGSDVNRTQLLGSLCPNCSMPVPPDSDFCGECGQAVKKSIPPPPPPPPKNISTETLDTPATAPTFSTISNETLKKIAVGVGGLLVLLVIISVISNVSKPSQSSSSMAINANTARVVNSNTNVSRMNNSSQVSENNFSVVGKYGYITINVNLRNGPDRRYDDIGTLYQNTRVKILQVAHREDSSDWWEVEVENSNDYGCSSVDPSRCGKDEPGDSSQGWINSKFVTFR